ncbi:hypothetical protein D0859_16744 [Hortaea werneckii]|uniref:DNA-directed RNA polymerase M/15kDa subunit domain-containing protein n=1 Tax=Hortaea werneckii TaxID=91943 RepID=A0A3M7I164_HORWE|nr:hypothetical protein D0859_16744 [Hortaea werneckii]
MLIISTIPHDHDGTHGGKNRFECRTCPYQMILDRKYYERKNMDLKGAEDVLGGADSWKNVDQAESFTPSPPPGPSEKMSRVFPNLIRKT